MATAACLGSESRGYRIYSGSRFIRRILHKRFLDFRIFMGIGGLVLIYDKVSSRIAEENQLEGKCLARHSNPSFARYLDGKVCQRGRWIRSRSFLCQGRKSENKHVVVANLNFKTSSSLMFVYREPYLTLNVLMKISTSDENPRSGTNSSLALCSYPRIMAVVSLLDVEADRLVFTSQ